MAAQVREITIRHDRGITLDEVLQVGAGEAPVRLDNETARLLDERQRQISAFISETGEPAYGFNRGFGHNVNLLVEMGENVPRLLQTNLILSHACGVGEPAPAPIVRGAMFLRAQSLARGYSGVRSVVVKQLIDFLNTGITPVVPRLGSVSASGDLVPLSHIALGLMGQGSVFSQGQKRPARQALAEAGIEPLRLDVKEGLALNNGVQYSTAIGVYCLDKVELLLKTACLATALSTQVMLGADTPFRRDLHALRPHPGAAQVADWIFRLMADSPIREAHRSYEIDGEVQDPYNIRCAAQILGACAELLRRAKETLVIEMNSVTDNPIILKATAENGWNRKYGGRYRDQFVEVVSGGHFHGMPVAIEMFNLLQALAIMAQLSNMRCVRYVDEARNKGLGSDLKWPGPTDDKELRKRQALWSGMMIPEYVSAALTNWIGGACMPSHLFSLSTDAGQEDHVSMAANVALRVMDTLPRLAETLAIELAFAAQAAAIRKEMDYIPSKSFGPDGETKKERYQWSPEQRRLNQVGEAVLQKIYEVFPKVMSDRCMADQIQELAECVLQGNILRTAEGFVKLGSIK